MNPFSQIVSKLKTDFGQIFNPPKKKITPSVPSFAIPTPATPTIGPMPFIGPVKPATPSLTPKAVSTPAPVASTASSIISTSGGFTPPTIIPQAQPTSTTPLGQTQYLKRNVNGTDVYTSSFPYGGNVPYGYETLTKDQYLQGLQQKLATAQNQIKNGLPQGYTGETYKQSDVDKYQQEINAINSGQGIYAPNYLDPSFAKFNPYGQPTEANFTAAEKARVAGIPSNLGGTGAPTSLPLNRDNTISSPAIPQIAPQNAPGGVSSPVTPNISPEAQTALETAQKAAEKAVQEDI